MDMLDVVARSHGGRGMQLLGTKFGLTERQTRAAIDQLAPAVMAGIRRQIRSGPDGVSGLLRALSKGNHARYLDSDEGIVDDGNAILGHVFGSKDVSRGVADRASAASGVAPDVLRKMLPVVSAMVMGALSQQVLGDQAATGTARRPERPSRAQRAPRSRGLGKTSRGAADRAATAEPEAAVPASSASEGGGLGGLLGQLLGGGQAGGGSAGGGGLGGLLGKLTGGGGSGSGSGAGGGGLGGLLGQLVGGGGGSAGAEGGGLGDILQGLLGSDANPEVRSQATQSIGGLLSGLLGGGTAGGDDADRLLDSLTSRSGR